MTASQGLFDHGGLRAGQRVLVHGARAALDISPTSWPKQPPGDHPPRPAERPVDFQAGSHQGDDHDELRQMLSPFRIFERVKLWKRREWRPGEQHSDENAANGQRKRHVPERHGKPRRQQDDDAENEKGHDISVQSVTSPLQTAGRRPLQPACLSAA